MKHTIIFENVNEEVSSDDRDTLQKVLDYWVSCNTYKYGDSHYFWEMSDLLIANLKHFLDNVVMERGSMYYINNDVMHVDKPRTLHVGQMHYLFKLKKIALPYYHGTDAIFIRME